MYVIETELNRSNNLWLKSDVAVFFGLFRRMFANLHLKLMIYYPYTVGTCTPKLVKFWKMTSCKPDRIVRRFFLWHQRQGYIKYSNVSTLWYTVSLL